MNVNGILNLVHLGGRNEDSRKSGINDKDAKGKGIEDVMHPL